MEEEGDPWGGAGTPQHSSVSEAPKITKHFMKPKISPELNIRQMETKE